MHRRQNSKLVVCDGNRRLNFFFVISELSCVNSDFENGAAKEFAVLGSLVSSSACAP